MIDRAEEDRGVRVADMGEVRRLVARQELAYPRDHALERIG
jgi:hypothetical protein